MKEFHSNTVLLLLSSWMQTSNVVTAKVQVEVLLDVSVAVQVTVVVPRGKHVPEGGVHATVTPGQLSAAVGVVKLTVWQGTVPTGGQTFGFVAAVMFAGQGPMVGAWQSLTVTVNEQLPVLPEASVAMQVTVVVPFGKNEPDAGEQVVGPTPGQLSVAVGVL